MSVEHGPKSMARRIAIGNKRPDRSSLLRELRSQGIINSAWVAIGFFLVAAAIVMLRENVVPYRPGQYVPQDIRSRVDFFFRDKAQLTKARQDARDSEPRVYMPNANGWDDLQTALLELPKELGDKTLNEVPPDLRRDLKLDNEPGALTALRQLESDTPAQKEIYATEVKNYVKKLSSLKVIGADDYRLETDDIVRHYIKLPDDVSIPKEQVYPAARNADPNRYDELAAVVRDAAKAYFLESPLRTRIEAFTLNTLKPTHVVDAAATTAAQNLAADRIGLDKEIHPYRSGQILVYKGPITEPDWQLLKAEKAQFIKNLEFRAVESKLGLAGMVLVLTVALAAYVVLFQPRVVRNTARSLAIGVLLLSMLLLAELAAIGTGPLYIFGLAPTILVAMILCIAYDRRFAMGVSTMHALLVTVALDQGVGFFLILWVGVLTCCFFMDDIRHRGKLIEVGGATALAMIVATIAVGATSFDPFKFIAANCLNTAAAGLAVGFVVLGILPFIEKLFKISTGMTLLELADTGQPLLRRLALEAPGTCNHSMQVASLAEGAAQAIGANSLLCRVASFYHDIGKINKPDYFIENQSGRPNKHLNLTANVSLLIIIGHVKDGLALAKEYNLPQQIFPFIQQHHGTTLVEYFYHQACVQQDQTEPGHQDISEIQFRYPGPKPKSKEIAIVMIADAVESAARAMREPAAGSIENLVHELAMKRLLDGQFDECDLTMRELELVERSLVKTLQGIYHGRIAYPTTPSGAKPSAPASGPLPTARPA